MQRTLLSSSVGDFRKRENGSEAAASVQARVRGEEFSRDSNGARRCFFFLEIIVGDFRSRDFLAASARSSIALKERRTDRAKRKTQTSFKPRHKREQNLCGLLVGRRRKSGRGKLTEREENERKRRTAEGGSPGRVQRAVSIVECSSLSLRFNSSSGSSSPFRLSEGRVYTM